MIGIDKKSLFDGVSIERFLLCVNNNNCIKTYGGTYNDLNSFTTWPFNGCNNQRLRSEEFYFIFGIIKYFSPPLFSNHGGMANFFQYFPCVTIL